MNLFSLIADQVQHKKDLFVNEGKIMDSLLTRGYLLHEADAALTLMQTLAQDQLDDLFEGEIIPELGVMRTMSTEERARFTVEAFSFLTKLTHLGIITGDQREDLIEKSLSLHATRIDLALVKELISVNLFANAPEQADFAEYSFRHKGAAWN